MGSTKELIKEKLDYEFSDLNEYYVDYKIKEKESVARMKKLNVESIPSVLIDGESKYQGTPNKQELQEDIIKKIEEKS